MPRLLVKSGDADPRSIPLLQGSMTLGRSPACDARIDDDSVSGTHCQIVVNADVVTVKDLGSTNGTFLDGEPITESAVKPGQTVRFGNVEAELIADPPRAPARERLRVTLSESPPPPPSTTASYVPDEYSEAIEGPTMCRFHRDSYARYLCPQCQQSFCELCVARRPDGKRTGMFCRRCSIECVALNVQLIGQRDRYSNFFVALPGMFLFPFQRGGWILMLCGAFFFGVLSVLGQLGGFFGIGMQVVSTGYLFAFLQKIVQSAAQGTDESLSWPDVTDFWQDVLQPFLQILATVLVCFMPAAVLAIKWNLGLSASGTAEVWKQIVIGVVLLGGAAYFPMAVLAVSIFDSVAALNPIVIIPSIVRLPLEYVTALVIMGVIFGIRVGGEYASGLLPIPFIPSFASTALGLYFLIVEMRMLGLMYYSGREKLGWFGR